MANRNGVKWSREETILAYELYCRTPFSKISQSNPEIKKLAELLGRTPGSVGLKMHNLAHYDPELKKEMLQQWHMAVNWMEKYLANFAMIGQNYHIRLRKFEQECKM